MAFPHRRRLLALRGEDVPAALDVREPARCGVLDLDDDLDEPRQREQQDVVDRRQQRTDLVVRDLVAQRQDDRRVVARGRAPLGRRRTRSEWARSLHVMQRCSRVFAAPRNEKALKSRVSVTT